MADYKNGTLSTSSMQSIRSLSTSMMSEQKMPSMKASGENKRRLTTSELEDIINSLQNVRCPVEDLQNNYLKSMDNSIKNIHLFSNELAAISEYYSALYSVFARKPRIQFPLGQNMPTEYASLLAIQKQIPTVRDDNNYKNQLTEIYNYINLILTANSLDEGSFKNFIEFLNNETGKITELRKTITSFEELLRPLDELLAKNTQLRYPLKKYSAPFITRLEEIRRQLPVISSEILIYKQLQNIYDTMDVLIRDYFPLRSLAETVTKNVKKTLWNLLAVELIDETKIGRLKNILQQMWSNSVVPPGSAVGYTASEAIGQHLMQMTLNSFHHTGALKNVNLGVASISEIFNISRKRSNESCVIHFIDHELTFGQIIGLRQQIIGVRLNDLIKTISFGKWYWSLSSARPSKDEIAPGNDASEEYKKVENDIWWMRLHTALYPSRDAQDNVSEHYFMRLQLDLDQLFMYRLDTRTIAEKIRKECEVPVICYPSPTNIGVIYIFAETSRIVKFIESKARTQESKEKLGITKAAFGGDAQLALFLLQYWAKPNLNTISIGGIKGISQIDPIGVNVISYIIGSEIFNLNSDMNPTEMSTKINAAIIRSSEYMKVNEPLSFLTNENKLVDIKTTDWAIWINPAKIMSEGIPLDKFTTFFKTAGMEVIFSPDDAKYDDEFINLFVVRMPQLLQKFPPDEYLTALTQISVNENSFRFLESDTVDEKRDGNEWIVMFNMKDEKDFIKIETLVQQSFNYKGGSAEEIRELDETKKVSSKVSKWKIKVSPYYGDNLTPIQIMKIMTFYDVNKQLASGQVNPITRACRYHFAIGTGSNLRRLLGHPLIDPKYTTSRNPREMVSSIGIEAARNSLVKALSDSIISADYKVDCRHVYLLVDFMTSVGILLPIASRSVARQNIGPFAWATFESPIPSIAQGTMGVRELVNTTSTCICTGKRAKVGTGLCDLIINEPMLEKEYHRQNLLQEDVIATEQAFEELNSTSLFDIPNSEDLLVGNPDLPIDGFGKAKTDAKRNDLCAKGPIPPIISNMKSPDILQLIIGNAQGNPIPKPIVVPSEGIYASRGGPIIVGRTFNEILRRGQDITYSYPYKYDTDIPLSRSYLSRLNGPSIKFEGIPQSMF